MNEKKNDAIQSSALKDNNQAINRHDLLTER